MVRAGPAAARPSNRTIRSRPLALTWGDGRVVSSSGTTRRMKSGPAASTMTDSRPAVGNAICCCWAPPLRPDAAAPVIRASQLNAVVFCCSRRAAAPTPTMTSVTLLPSRRTFISTEATCRAFAGATNRAGPTQPVVTRPSASALEQQRRVRAFITSKLVSSAVSTDRIDGIGVQPAWC